MKIQELIDREIAPLCKGLVDITLEPEKAGTVVREYMRKSAPEISAEASYLILYTKLAQVLALDRVVIESNHIDSNKKIFPNMFSILFLSSGTGKDKIVDGLDHDFFSPIWLDFKDRYGAWMVTEDARIKDEVETKYKKSGAEKEKYIQAQLPRDLVIEVDSGTPEAIHSVRESLSAARMGGVFFKHPEFTDFFVSKNTLNMEFLNVMKKSYEGDLGVKVIKSEKRAKETKGVPMNMLAYSSIYGLEKNREDVLSVFSRGMARRSFVYVETEVPSIASKLEEETDFDQIYEELVHGKDNLKSVVEYCKPFFWSLYTANRDNVPELPTEFGSAYKFDKEADVILKLYSLHCKNQMSNLASDSEKEYITSEVKNRHWKVMKLATVIAAFEHPTAKVVTRDDVRFAIVLCEIFSEHYRKFIVSQESNSPYDSLIEFLKKNEGNWYLKGDIMQQGFIGRNEFARWFEQAIEYCETYFYATDYTFETSKANTNGFKIRVTKKDQTQDTYTLSISTDNKDVASKEYKVVTTTLQKLPELAKKHQYSNLIWKDGQRHSDNFSHGSSLVIFDIDSETTLQEALEGLESKKLSAVAITTPNHKKEKNGVVTDRFRIILPLEYKFVGDIDKWKRSLEGLSEALGLKVDKSAFDGARHYRASPVDAQVHILEGSKINLDMYEKKPPEKKSRGKTDSSILSKKPNYKSYETFLTKECVEGNRNNAFSRVAKWMRDEGISRDDCEDFLESYNNKLAKTLPDSEMRLIIKSTFK